MGETSDPHSHQTLLKSLAHNILEWPLPIPGDDRAIKRLRYHSHSVVLGRERQGVATTSEEWFQD